MYNVEDITYMEKDQFQPGNILYINSAAMKSLNTSHWQPHVIAGRDNFDEYQEGQGSNARFNFMESFYQRNSTTVIVADSGNNCVRIVDRITNTTSRLSGRCGDPDGFGSIDGPFYSAGFASPSFFVRLPTTVSGGHEQLAFKDFSAVRKIDFTTETVSTMAQDDQIQQLSALTINPDNSSLYLSFLNGIAKLDLLTNKLTILSLSRRHGRPVDGPLSVAVFESGISSLTFLNPSVLLISDYNNDMIRVVDLITEEVTSLCQIPEASKYSCYGGVKSGDIQECAVCSPNALLVIPEKNQVLLGSVGFFGYIKTTGL